jgi:Protein of unknown function (DUF1553)/Protein of unknown function (DUF1549)/Planctomycete cytochrome C
MRNPIPRPSFPPTLAAAWLLAGLCAGVVRLGAAETTDRAGVEFFETKIRPVLADKCYRCHSAESEKIKAHLYLDSRDGMLSGGDSGPAMVPGEPDKSRIIEALRWRNEDMQMPPKEQLPEAVVQDFAVWVKMGAPDPRPAKVAAKTNARAAIDAATKTHWAYQPLTAGSVPTVAHAALVHTPIDALVWAKLEPVGLQLAPPADRRTLLRRATVDLTGLPPSAEEVEAFLADHGADAFAKVVDRLLASPHYGERWGRYWLDVARYADTKGYVFEEDRHYPFAFTYRDWVVGAINDDLPYDKFLIEQIAADQLPLGDDKRPLAALGFLTLGRRFLNQAPDIIDDRIDVVCRGTMALTVGCARCHDHKFDAIPTKDYYSLYGVFDSSHEPKELPLLGHQEASEEKTAFERELAKANAATDAFIAKRHAEVLAHIREAAVIADYLLAAHDTGALNGKDADALVQKRNLRHELMRRWQAQLKKAGDSDAVLAPWVAYARLAEGDFAAKAAGTAAKLATMTLNPLIAKAFAGPAPASLKEVASRYGAALKAADGDQPKADAPEEALRLLLRAPESPTAVTLGDAERILFDGDDAKKIRDLRKKADELVATHPGSPPRAMVLEDLPSPHTPHVFVRGNPNNQGDEVPRQFLAVLSGPERKPFSKGSGRLELAQAIASPGNPLTARVFVNRVWAHHFGSGLVRTPSDFGLRSDPPLNRELLDWLAKRFIDDGWSLKKLHRQIMLTAVYQQGSDNQSADAKLDPDNARLWHFNRQRLDFESMRDGVLVVAGDLDGRLGGRAVDLTTQPYTTRRTIYGLIDRQNLANVFRTFDFASPDAHSPQRYQTSVPQQSLFLMNSPFVVEQARRLAKLSEDAGADQQARVQRLYRQVYARAASADEVRIAASYLKLAAESPAQPPESQQLAWQYGYGRFDAISGRIADFTRMAHFTDKAWHGGEKLPDKALAYLSLSENGGHPGPDLAHPAIRRWISPVDGTVAVSGRLARPAKEGDGVHGLVVSSRGGKLGEWTVKSGESETAVERIEVKKGDTIDFVVDCIGNDGFDSFQWAPVVRLLGGSPNEWDAAKQFGGPPAKPLPPLSPWEKYAQVLIMSNEFAFVD